jgi:pantoate--beta-alanine ligase
MQEVARLPALHELVRRARCAGQTIGFVQTMGYVHEGHLQLVAEARAENDLVVMSIFVNPTQFGPQEDFERYPRDVERDRRLAQERGVDVLFLPDMGTMYPGGPEAQTIWVDPGELASAMEGASRPGHFRGVATIVTKLFTMVQPDRAYFGQKDAQQAMIVTRMARDLAFPLEVRVVPTVRESDGLAMSSRNVYLTRDEREQAPVLARALELARSVITEGVRDPRRIETAMQELIERSAPLAHVDYVCVADLETLQPAERPLESDALIALAVYFGATRLIDNTIVRFVEGMPHFT